MGACWNWLSPVSGWQFILLEMKWIRYYLKAPYPEKRRKKKKRNVCMKFLQRRMAVYLKNVFVVIHQGFGHFPSSMFDCLCRCQGNWSTCKYGSGFSCFVMRWRCLEFLLAAPLPLHARNVVLKSEIGTKRKSSLPQTPLGGFSPIPGGPEVSPYFLSIIRSIK